MIDLERQCQHFPHIWSIHYTVWEPKFIDLISYAVQQQCDRRNLTEINISSTQTFLSDPSCEDSCLLHHRQTNQVLSLMEFFAEFSDKNICSYSKRARTCHSATSCVRDQHATTAPARHMWETGSFNQAQFMLHWLSVPLNSLNSVKVLLHLGKTPICHWLLIGLHI